jgi:ligand-binding sensor domain-containing protein
MQKRTAILLFSLLASVVVFAQNAVLKFDHFSEQYQLSSSTAEVFFQDSRGILWIGTWDGLNKYDGYSITIYKSDATDTTTLTGNTITCITEDQFGGLWVGTSEGLNLYNRSSDDFTRVKHDPAIDSSLSNNTINDLELDGQNNLWVGTYWGLNRLDLNTHKDKPYSFSRYFKSDDKPGSLSSNLINGLALDRDKKLWISTNTSYLSCYDAENDQFIKYKIDVKDIDGYQGVMKLVYSDQDNDLFIVIRNKLLIHWNRSQNTFTTYQHDPNNKNSLSSNNIRSIAMDKKGNIWISTDGGGLNVLNKKTGAIQHYQYNASDPYSLTSNGTYATYEDRSGIIWIGTYNSGVNKLVYNKTNFGHYSNQPGVLNCLSHKLVRSIFQDSKDQIWIGTDGGGLNQFDQWRGTFKHYRSNQKDDASLSSDIVTAIGEDDDGNLWLGSWQGGLTRLNTTTGKTKRFKHDWKDSTTISSDIIWSILSDSKKNLWIGTETGLNLYSKESQTFSQFTFYDSETSNSINTLFEDRENRLWVGSQSGLLVANLKGAQPGISRYTPVFENFEAIADRPGLNSNVIKVINQDDTGNIWIGTDKGINILNPSTHEIKSLTIADGLAGNIIYGIVEDQHNNIWISTNNGISRFQSTDGTFKNYDTGDGLQSMEFISNGIITQAGWILFGGINGFNIFNPGQLKENTHVPPIILTGLKIFNTPVKPGEHINGRVVLNQTITETKKLVLAHGENFFSISLRPWISTIPTEINLHTGWRDLIQNGITSGINTKPFTPT